MTHENILTRKLYAQKKSTTKISRIAVLSIVLLITSSEAEWGHGAPLLIKLQQGLIVTKIVHENEATLQADSHDVQSRRLDQDPHRRAPPTEGMDKLTAKKQEWEKQVLTK